MNDSVGHEEKEGRAFERTVVIAADAVAQPAVALPHQRRRRVRKRQNKHRNFKEGKIPAPYGEQIAQIERDRMERPAVGLAGNVVDGVKASLVFQPEYERGEAAANG